MISFLASPKPFIGWISVIQQQAIRSWLGVHPLSDVTLFGRFGELPEWLRLDRRVRIYTDVPASPSGAPDFSAIAIESMNGHYHEVQIYLNADIIMPKNLISVLSLVTTSPYLIIGQRINLPENYVFPLESADWNGVIRGLVDNKLAELYAISGVDYFIFKKGTWRGLKRLIVGRGGYDGALVAHCLRKRIEIFDATIVLPVLHQYHDYSHMRGGLSEARDGSEAISNYIIHDIYHGTPGTSDAKFMLTKSGVVCSRCRGDYIRFLEVGLRYKYNLKYLSLFVRTIWRAKEYFGAFPSKKILIDDIIEKNEKQN